MQGSRSSRSLPWASRSCCLLQKDAEQRGALKSDFIPGRIRELGFAPEVVGLHVTNASQQERGRNAEKSAAVLRTERAPGLVPVKGDGVC